MKALATLALMFALSPAYAVSEWGNKNAVIYLGTGTVGTQTFYIGTGNSRAASGAILAYISISSAVAASGTFEVYDSSTTDLTGRSVLYGVLCSALNTFPVFLEANYGLTVVSKACTGRLSYLTHK